MGLLPCAQDLFCHRLRVTHKFIRPLGGSSASSFGILQLSSQHSSGEQGDTSVHQVEARADRMNVAVPIVLHSNTCLDIDS